jgi:vancomycin permeability regulator SanA
MLGTVVRLRGAVRAVVNRLRKVPRWLVVTVVVLALLVLGGPWTWMRIDSWNRITDEAAAGPADVAIVFGASVAVDRRTPMPFLRGRIETGIDLLKAGKAKVLLMSGDANSARGNEPEVMKRYAVEHGVDPARIVEDPYGLDTYDTCRRARDTYGVRRALLVSQSLHLPRAVTLCRTLGVEAYGVTARCEDCQWVTQVYLSSREVAAGSKAVWDVTTHRQPVVQSPPDQAVHAALGQ